MSKASRHVAYVTGTRADFGLMTRILNEIHRSTSLQLELYATGMHLMPEFGKTLSDVRAAFPQTRTIEATFPYTKNYSLAKFTTHFLPKLIHSFSVNRPDLVLVLGDRVEMLCVAMASLYLNLPVAHIHGGEKTTTVDDTARHAISKLSHLHLPATRIAAKRLRTMGEEPWRIHVVGAPAIDATVQSRLPSRIELFHKLHLNPQLPLILVTQHPVSEESDSAGKQMTEILAAVKNANLQTLITYPNADPGSRGIIQAIRRAKTNPHLHVVKSLPYHEFLALQRETAVWVGNSSAGIIESASFKTPVVNIGSRQHNRERGANVLDAPPKKRAIERAMRRVLTDSAFHRKLRYVRNPWGDGRTAPRVRRILEQLPLNPRLIQKKLTYA